MKKLIGTMKGSLWMCSDVYVIAFVFICVSIQKVSKVTSRRIYSCVMKYKRKMHQKHGSKRILFYLLTYNYLTGKPALQVTMMIHIANQVLAFSVHIIIITSKMSTFKSAPALFHLFHDRVAIKIWQFCDHGINWWICVIGKVSKCVQNGYQSLKHGDAYHTLTKGLSRQMKCGYYSLIGYMKFCLGTCTFKILILVLAV